MHLEVQRLVAHGVQQDVHVVQLEVHEVQLEVEGVEVVQEDAVDEDQDDAVGDVQDEATTSSHQEVRRLVPQLVVLLRRDVLALVVERHSSARPAVLTRQPRWR